MSKSDDALGFLGGCAIVGFTVWVHIQGCSYTETLPMPLSDPLRTPVQSPNRLLAEPPADPWSRGDTMALIGLVFAGLSCIAAWAALDRRSDD